MFLPSMFLAKEYTGMPGLVELKRYCCVLIPSNTFSSWGDPNWLLSCIEALSTLINCSYQLVLVGSFHKIFCSAKSRPLLSIIDSDVVTDTIFNKPLAG